MNNLEKYAKPTLRIAMGLVFVYFGIQQIIAPIEWSGFIPDYVLIFGISAVKLTLMHGFFELGLGLLLVLGLYTRIIAIILAINLFFISISLGINDVGIRDLGLSISTLVVFFNGIDNLCLDNKFSK